MKQLTKERFNELHGILFRGRADPLGAALAELLAGERENVKEGAITPGAVDVSYAQGQAAAYAKILKCLTEPPVTKKPI